MFTQTFPISSEGGHNSFQNNVPDPVTSGKELPTFKFELEKSEGRVMEGSFGKEATVEQLPISKGIAGVSMRMEPGVMRELHWHATAAEWAFVTEGGCAPRSSIPQGCSETNDFEPGDIWYFPRGHGHVIESPGRQAVPLHPGLRQRLLLRVRHLQHHRLAGPRAQGTAGQELRRARIHLRQLPQERGVLRQGEDSAADRRAAACGLEAAAADPQVQPAFAEAVRESSRAAWSGASMAPQFPISTTMTGVVLEMEAGRAARIALAPQCRRVAVRPERRIQCDAVRLAGPLARRATEQGDVGYIPQGFGHSIENVGKEKARILIVFNNGHYQTIDLSQWIAGNPPDVLATNFGQDASVFEKFPRKDVFLTK